MLKHYEIMLLVHPERHEQVSTMTGRYRQMIESGGGRIHRLEEWGVRKLAYPIKRVYKACYVLMNIECGQETIEELERAFRFNDAIIRNMVLLRARAITGPSPLSGEDAGEESRAEETGLPAEAARKTEKRAAPDGTQATPNEG